MDKVRKVVTINTDLKECIRLYLIFTKYINKLRPAEINLVTEMIYYYLVEFDNFKRDEDRWKKVFDYESKIKYREILEIEDYSLQSMLSSLRKKNVIKDNVIKAALIPKIKKENDNFQLVFNFKFKPLC